MKFHLAFPVKDLESTRKFYVDVIGCKPGRSADTWIDLDFYGHQISAHVNPNHGRVDTENRVETKDVPVPHFGVILDYEQFDELEAKLRENAVLFHHEPFTRFKDQPGEQRSMFLKDPSGNCLEFKAFKSDNMVFEHQ